MPSWRKVILSGSDAALNTLSVSSSITASVVSASQFTGSLFGTASWAQSASNAINSQTASFLPVGTYNITASWAQSASNAINARTASFINNLNQDLSITGAVVLSGSSLPELRVIGETQFTGSVGSTGGFTGSLLGTASWATNALTASFAPNYVLTSVTSSMLAPYVPNSQTSSFVQNSQTSSMLAPYVPNSQTSSFVRNSQTSSMTVLSSSFALTASLAPNYVLTSVTSSMLAPYVPNSQTSSFVRNSQTSSFVQNSQTSSFVQNSQTSSMLAPYVLTSVTSSMLAPYVLTSVTSSMLAPYVLTSVTSSMLAPYVPNSQTSSFVRNSQTSSMTVLSSSFAQTASFLPVGTYNITSSWATNALTASFAPNYVLTSVTSSMLAPYVLTSVTSSMLAPYVPNSQTSSFVQNSQTSSMLAPYVLTSVTSSMLAPYVPNSQTSSFVRNNQTSSFVQNSQTSSFVQNNQTSSMTVLSSSFALTASFAPNYVLTSVTSSMLAPYVLNSQTSSFVQNSQTSSMLAPYVPNSQTSSFVRNSQTSSMTVLSSSFSQTASFLPVGIYNITASWATNALTASFVNTLNQNLIITGTVSIGTSSIGPNENTLTLGARDTTSEGGQLGLNAPGGTYTSASFIDLYQNRFRVLRGTNASSDAELFSINLHTGQLVTNRYTGSGAFPGTAAGYLAVDTAGNVITADGVGGGVTQIVAGTNISISPAGGTGIVTINSTGGSGTTFPYTGSAIISGSLIVTGSTVSTGGFTGSLLGTASQALTASFALTTPPPPNQPLLFIYSSSGASDPTSVPSGYILEQDGTLDNLYVSTQSYNNVNLAPIGFANYYFTEIGSLATLRATGSGAFRIYRILNYGPYTNYSQYTVQLTTTIASGTINTGDVVEFRWDKSAGIGQLTEALGFFDVSNTYNTDGIDIYFNNGTIIAPGTPGGTISSLSYTGSGYIAAAVTKSANLTISSLNATQGLTGSLLGTASRAITASHALNGGVTSIIAGSGISVNQSTGAVTITNTGGGGSTFPYTGSAIISGSLIVTGSTEITQNLSASALKIGNLDRPLSLTGGSSFVSLNPKIKSLGTNNSIDIESNLILSASTKLAFKDFDNTYITSNNDSPEDLEIHADQDILLLSDNNVGIKTPTPTSASLHVSGNIFADSITGSLLGTASQALTASFTPNAITTASVSLNTITFTKGSGTTFNITVNTGSGGGGGVTINNNTDNYLVTATGTANTLNGESRLTYDQSSLFVSGNIIVDEGFGTITLSDNISYFNTIEVGGISTLDKVTVNTTLSTPELNASLINVTNLDGLSPVTGDFGEGSRIASGWGKTGSILTAGRIVYLNTATQWVDTQANATGSSIGVLGVIDRNASSGSVLLTGVAKVSSSLSSATIGRPVYLSPTVAGGVTATVPSSSGQIARVIGYVIAPGDNLVYFNPSPTWIAL